MAPGPLSLDSSAWHTSCITACLVLVWFLGHWVPQGSNSQLFYIFTDSTERYEECRSYFNLWTLNQSLLIIHYSEKWWSWVKPSSQLISFGCYIIFFLYLTFCTISLHFMLTWCDAFISYRNILSHEPKKVTSFSCLSSRWIYLCYIEGYTQLLKLVNLREVVDIPWFSMMLWKCVEGMSKLSMKCVWIVFTYFIWILSLRNPLLYNCVQS